jgi:hypothetical protein
VRHGNGEGQLRALHGEAEAQAARARNQAVLAVLRLGHVAAVHQGLEDAVDAGLGDAGLLVNILERDRSVIFFQQLDHIERLGEDGNQVKPLDFCLGQTIVSLVLSASTACGNQYEPYPQPVAKIEISDLASRRG